MIFSASAANLSSDIGTGNCSLCSIVINAQAQEVCPSHPPEQPNPAQGCSGISLFTGDWVRAYVQQDSNVAQVIYDSHYAPDPMYRGYVADKVSRLKLFL